MDYCNCSTCKLNGLQGRLAIVYNDKQYCTAHPQYLYIKRYMQSIDGALGKPLASIPLPVKPTVYTPSARRKPELHTYVLSFRDQHGVEQDWFIKSDCDEYASEQAIQVMKNLPFQVRDYTFIRETHVTFIELLNR